MKKILSLILIGLLLFSCFGLTVCAMEYSTAALPLRAGGGGSGGGGSSGGSSGSGGHGYHSGGGYYGSPLGFIIHALSIPIILFSSSIVFYFTVTKRSRKSKKLMKQMMKSDRAWKYRNISSSVRESYMAIQAAWAKGDMTDAAEYMSDELFNSFQVKLKWMSYRKERNVLKNIQLLKALPVAVYDDEDNSRDFIWFYIKGKMTDYTVNTETQQKISGSTSAASFVEYWKYVRNGDRWVLAQILQKDEADQIPFND